MGLERESKTVRDRDRQTPRKHGQRLLTNRESRVFVFVLVYVTVTVA